MASTKTLNIAVNATGNAVEKLNQVGKSIDHITRGMSNFNKATRLAAFNERLGKVNLKMNSMGKIIETGTGKFVSMDKAVQAVGKSMGGLNKRAATFDMRLLSLLFGGMALRRAFGGVLRSVFDTFKRAEDNTSGLNQATVRLSASWEFLKFSIFDALNTDFFINFIDGIIRVINNFAQMGAGWKITFLAVSAGLFILGTGMMLIGQFKLGWDAIFGIGGFLRGSGTILGKLSTIKGTLMFMSNLLAVGFTFWLAFQGWKDFQDGDLAGVFGALATGVIIWTAGLGYAIPFFLVFKGLQFGVPKLMEKIAEIKEAKDFFPTTNIVSIISERLGLGSDSIMGKLLGITPQLEKQMDILFPEEVTKRIDAARTSTGTLATVMEEDLIPQTDNVIDTITGEDGLVDSLESQGDEMDIISGEKTNGLLASTDSIIAKNETLIKSNDDVTASFERRLNSFRESTLEEDTQSSSVSGDDR